MWWCKGCKKQFSVKVGTIFEDSPLGMDKWMTAFWMVVNCKNGVSSAEMARTLKITQKSAWFMLHRVREVLKNNSVAKLGSTGGAVESDETFIGPKPQRMHKDRRVKLAAIRSQHRLGDMYLGKTAVIGMLDRDAREIRRKVIPNIRRETLQNEILNNVEYGGKALHGRRQWIHGHRTRPSCMKSSTMQTSTSVDRFTPTDSKISGACSSAICAEPT